MRAASCDCITRPLASLNSHEMKLIYNKALRIAEPQTPTCLHALGQDLVNVLHAEGDKGFDPDAPIDELNKDEGRSDSIRDAAMDAHRWLTPELLDLDFIETWQKESYAKEWEELAEAIEARDTDGGGHEEQECNP